MRFSARKARTKSEIKAALGIRGHVFVKEQNVAPELEYDGKDEESEHFLVFAGRNAIGTGRMRLVSKKEENFCLKCMRTGRQPELLQNEWKKAAEGPKKQRDIVKLERICVLRKWRGKGAGAALTKFMVLAAKRKRARELVLHSQCVAIPFYESLGFRPRGPLFTDAGIRHRTMSIRTRPWRARLQPRLS